MPKLITYKKRERRSGIERISVMGGAGRKVYRKNSN